MGAWISPQMGKRIAVFGFGGRVMLSALYVILYVLQTLLRVMVPAAVSTLISVAGNLLLGLAGIGFLVMWLGRGGIFDFVSGLATGLAALISLILTVISLINGYVSYGGGAAMQLLLLLGLSLYLLLLAVRAGRRRFLLAVLMVLFFLWNFILSPIVLSRFINVSGAGSVASLVSATIGLMINLACYRVVKGEPLAR